MPQEHDDEASHHRGGRAPAFLSRPIPLWLLLAAVAMVGAVLTVALFLERQSSVDLGPAVGTAERIEVDITLCNGEVDRLDLNPRRVELDLEDILRDEGAAATNVTVERRDCPRPR